MTKVTKATKLEDSVITETLREYKGICSPSEADVVNSLRKQCSPKNWLIVILDVLHNPFAFISVLTAHSTFLRHYLLVPHIFLT